MEPELLVFDCVYYTLLQEMVLMFHPCRRRVMYFRLSQDHAGNLNWFAAPQFRGKVLITELHFKCKYWVWTYLKENTNERNTKYKAVKC